MTVSDWTILTFGMVVGWMGYHLHKLYQDVRCFKREADYTRDRQIRLAEEVSRLDMKVVRLDIDHASWQTVRDLARTLGYTWMPAAGSGWTKIKPQRKVSK